MLERTGRRGALLGITSAICVGLGVFPAWAASSEEPDLTVTITTDAPAVVARGDLVTYTVAVRNLGGAPATEVAVTDELPVGTAPVGGVPSLDRPGVCSAVGGASPGGSAYSVTCGLPMLTAGDTAIMTYAVRVGDATPCGSVKNAVSVSAVDEPLGAVDDANHASAPFELACVCAVGLDVDIARVGLGRARSIYSVTNAGDLTAAITVSDRTLGSVGRVRLRAGGQRSFSRVFSIESQTVRAVATVIAEPAEGPGCRERAFAVRSFSSGGPDQDPAVDEVAPPGDTAFTGVHDLPATIAIILLVLGLGSLAGARRHS